MNVCIVFRIHNMLIIILKLIELVLLCQELDRSLLLTEDWFQIV